jgi:hypothetical protein
LLGLLLRCLWKSPETNRRAVVANTWAIRSFGSFPHFYPQPKRFTTKLNRFPLLPPPGAAKVASRSSHDRLQGLMAKTFNRRVDRLAIPRMPALKGARELVESAPTEYPWEIISYTGERHVHLRHPTAYLVPRYLSGLTVNFTH